MNVLSIQSHVVYGHVGNRSAVFPLERMGIEVWPINTVQFSYNTGKPGWSGTAFGSANIHEVIGSLDSRGILDHCDALLSGYMGDVDTGKAILDAVDRVRKANPAAIFCCDPVMGDYPRGLYVKPELSVLMRDQVVPRANIVTPNRFEAELLCGIRIDSLASALRAVDSIHTMGPDIVILTSFKPEGEETIGFLVSDGGKHYCISTPLLTFPLPPKGSGDLVSALFLGYYLHGHDVQTAIEYAASTLYAILERTLGSESEELAIIQMQSNIANPDRRFKLKIL